MTINIKRAYEPYESSDGFRILVDRLWPRGISKEKARLDVWLKDIAPSDSLRKSFGHDPFRWDEFAARYRKELGKNRQTLGKLKDIIANKKKITLVRPGMSFVITPLC